MVRSEAVVDLGAIRDNVRLLRSRTPAEVMAVVKADGYGHGLLPSARAALAGGASWLGVAFLEEALALRPAGITAPMLSWLAAPGRGPRRRGGRGRRPVRQRAVDDRPRSSPRPGTPASRPGCT